METLFFRPQQPTLPSYEESTTDSQKHQLREDYKLLMVQYKAASDLHDRAASALAKVDEYIDMTLGIGAQSLWDEDISLYQNLKALQRRFKGDEFAQSRHFEERLKALKAGHKTKDVDMWCSQWVTLSREMTASRARNYDTMRQEFIECVEETNEFVGIMLKRDYLRDKNITIERLTDEYADLVRDKKPSRSTHATLALAENKPTSERTSQGYKGQSTLAKNTAKPCVDLTGTGTCATRAACDVVNPRNRPPREQRSREWRQQFEYYLSVLRQDEGKIAIPKRFHDTEVLNALKKGKGKEKRSQSNERDDDKLSTMATIMNASQNTRFSQWALDTCSDVHVINESMRHLLFDVKPCSTRLATGDASTKTKEVGSIILPMRTLAGQLHQVTFAEVVYVPGFHLNIISEPRIARKGLHFNAQDMCLYRNNKPYF